jgi:S1-C subfamily serine protease
LWEGNVITEIDSQSVAQPGDIQCYLAQAQAGQPANLGIIRKWQQMHVSVTLEANPTQTP